MSIVAESWSGPGTVIRGSRQGFKNNPIEWSGAFVALINENTEGMKKTLEVELRKRSMLG